MAPTDSSQKKGPRAPLQRAIRRQVAQILRKVVVGDEKRKSHASIKALIYDPSIVAKKATLALTCRCLKCECPHRLADVHCAFHPVAMRTLQKQSGQSNSRPHEDLFALSSCSMGHCQGPADCQRVALGHCPRSIITMFKGLQQCESCTTDKLMLIWNATNSQAQAQVFCNYVSS